MRKHGLEQFSYVVLSWHASEHEAYLEEQNLINEWDLCNPEFGYNLTFGGRGGCRMSDETRAKMSRVASQNLSLKGRKCSDETKKLLSEALSGSRNPNYGKQKSDSTKQKMSDSQKGRTLTDEHKEKLRLAKLGKKTGRKIPPQLAEARRLSKGTQAPRDAAKLGWERRKLKQKLEKEKENQASDLDFQGNNFPV